MPFLHDFSKLNVLCRPQEEALEGTSVAKRSSNLNNKHPMIYVIEITNKRQPSLRMELYLWDHSKRAMVAGGNSRLFEHEI